MLLLTLFFLIHDPPLCQKRIPKEEARGINANSSSWGCKPPAPWTKEVGLLGCSVPARRWAVSLVTAAGSVICHSSRGGDSGIQLLKQLGGDRGALGERAFKTPCPLLGKALSSELLERGEEGARAPSQE